MGRKDTPGGNVVDLRCAFSGEIPNKTRFKTSDRMRGPRHTSPNREHVPRCFPSDNVGFGHPPGGQPRDPPHARCDVAQIAFRNGGLRIHGMQAGVCLNPVGILRCFLRLSPKLARFGSNVVESSTPLAPESARFGPESAEFGPTSAKFGSTLANMDQRWPQIGHGWPQNSARFGPDLRRRGRGGDLGKRGAEFP